MPNATILFLIIFFGTLTASLFRPWIGVIAYTLFSLWFPHAIWPWVFRGAGYNIRISYVIALAVMIGFGLAYIKKGIDFGVLRHRQNLYLFILWLCLILSYVFRSYDVGLESRIAIQNPVYLINNMTKVILFYYVSVLLINTKEKLHYYTMVILFCGVFYVYWGNKEFFSGHLMGFYNTLIGPGFRRHGIMSPYFDENAFAMLYVMVIPFLFFMGDYYNNRIIKYFLWLNIPFAWHCIFLTGSRGGLLGLGMVTLFITLRSKKKILMFAIPLALLIAFIDQGGIYLKTRAISAVDVQQDSSVQSRFNSWTAGLRMTMDHPLLGVGIGNFLTAYPDYSDTKPFVAHNTLIQFMSESGILAGLMYLLLCIGIFKGFLKQSRTYEKIVDPLFNAVNESVAGSLSGFFICAIFLNLATYEIFYYLLVLNAVKNTLVEDTLVESTTEGRYDLKHQLEFVS